VEALGIEDALDNAAGRDVLLVQRATKARPGVKPFAAAAAAAAAASTAASTATVAAFASFMAACDVTKAASAATCKSAHRTSASCLVFHACLLFHATAAATSGGAAAASAAVTTTSHWWLGDMLVDWRPLLSLSLISSSSGLCRALFVGAAQATFHVPFERYHATRLQIVFQSKVQQSTRVHRRPARDQHVFNRQAFVCRPTRHSRRTVLRCGRAGRAAGV
jgi:hypothetical protein